MGFHVVLLVKTFLLMYQLATNVVRTDINEAKVISALQHKSKNTRQNSILSFKILCFHVVASTRDDLSIDVSITNLVLILTKLRRSQLSSTTENTSQNSVSNLFEKKKKLGIPCCSTCEDLSYDASITNVGLILTKPL